jgi:hypothetical protein
MAMQFWYEYDNFFLFSSSPETRVAIRAVDPYGRLLDLFYYHQRTGTVESAFKTDLANVKDSFKFLADNERRIIEKHFKGNADTEGNAFELFAQGLLFDSGLDDKGLPRRPEGDKVHMMDSSIDGYIAWHAFVRAIVVLLSEDQGFNKEVLLSTDRHIALAAAILASLIKSGRTPLQTNDPAHNKPIDSKLLNELRALWLHLGFEEIDQKLVQLQEEVISRHNRP